jgi:hypothetical protein
MSFWSDIVGIVKGYLVLGKGGVRLQNSSGTLALRNAGDTGNASLTASSCTLDTLGFRNSATGGITGTSTNDDAASGIVGEHAASEITFASAVSLTSNTAKSVTSITLTHGDWDVSGIVHFDPAAATSVTDILMSLSTTDNTADTAPSSFSARASSAFVPGNDAIMSLAVPSKRVSISASTTVYLVAYSLFTLGTMKAYGVIQARRCR